MAITGAVLLTVGAVAGPVGIGAAALITIVACLVVASTSLGGKRYDAPLTAAVAFAVGSCCASPVLGRAWLGFAPAMVLLMSVHAYEASTFIIGSGARHRWEAPISAAAAVAAVSLAASAVFVPPFRGVSAWVLGALALALTGASRRVASAVLPRHDAHVPAFRRVDGFLITGAVWVVVGLAVLDVRL